MSAAHQEVAPPLTPEAVRRRLASRRVVCRFVFAFEAAALAMCVHYLAPKRDLWLDYVWTLAVVLGGGHGVWLLLVWAIGRASRVRVRSSGDRWRIGNYTEAQVRRLVREVREDLPARVRRIRVYIQDDRSTNAWTQLPMQWLRRRPRRHITLTHGALHYLDPAEIKAVLHHEVAHHLPSNRYGPPGGWLLGGVVVHALVFTLNSAVGLPPAWTLLFWLYAWAAATAVACAWAAPGDRDVEHACDLFAAGRVGQAPVVNALVKLAEEAELTHAVLARAAHELADWRDLDLLEVVEAFSEVRPYGRLFHENLFRHADETVKHVLAHASGKRKPRGKPNEELSGFVAEWLHLPRPRLRWRRFDRDGDGRLDADEIALLRQALLAEPDRLLARTSEEVEPTTHPSMRDRVLLLTV